MSLVQIPWQPDLWLAPSTLGYLLKLRDRIGYNPFVVRSGGAWRAYYSQKYYWDGWVARRPGFSPASNPDTGPRQHMRGAAFDLLDTSAAMQRHCRALGLIREPSEAWHWNDPRWASMPVIKTNTSAAGGGSTPIDPKEYEMSASDTATIIKLLSEIHQPLLNGALEQIGRIDKNTGETHQAIYETEQWEGINARLGRVAAAVEGGKPATVQIDAAALAATLAPLLKTGATAEDIVTALRGEFDAIPGKVRANLIKD